MSDCVDIRGTKTGCRSPGGTKGVSGTSLDGIGIGAHRSPDQRSRSGSGNTESGHRGDSLGGTVPPPAFPYPALSRKNGTMGYRPYRSLAAALTILALIPGMVLAHASAQERLTRLDESIAADPSNPELYLKRGHFWGEMKQWDEALADYDRAIELRADVGKVDFARGKLLLAAGHPALAEIILDGILNAKPDHPRGLHVRARARTALGRHSEAADDLLSAVNAMASPSPDV